ncbi:MAG: helix-turn-helix domain-containing protein [Myxococcota bacterium]
MSSGFGEALRRWRKLRRYTQLDLAAEAEVSTRHLSCLETGKASPSRFMTLTLAEVLDVPMEETNRLLTLAGFAPAYRARGLEGPDAEPVRRAIWFLLGRHQPYPAVVVDPGWNAVMANDAYVRFSRWLWEGDASLVEAAEPDRLHDGPPVAGNNVLLPLFDHERLRPLVSNFDVFAAHIFQHLRRAARDEPAAAQTLRSIEVLGGRPGPQEFDAVAPVVVPLELAVRDQSFRLFTTMTLFASSADTMLSSLRIETFFAADGETDRRLLAITQSSEVVG